MFHNSWPRVPLSQGIVDRFLESEPAIFGPSQEQAKLESSKCYAKEFMKRNSIPTADFEAFRDPQKAMDYAARYSGIVVVKADGLASGKGVFVCSSQGEAERAIKSIMVERFFGDAGSSVIVEEKLAGREISLMTLCNGKEAGAIPFGTATDHKRLLDKNMGPNTGGMGAYSPSLDFDSRRISEVMESVISPTVAETGFIGFLYAGLMVNGSDVKVLEFNARLGDPETQVILPRLDSDLFKLVLGAYEGERLNDEDRCKWNNFYSCCVAMCSEGYPSDPRTGDEIRGVDFSNERDSLTFVFHAGTKKHGQSLLTAGGRVLYVTSLGPTLNTASDRAYETVKKISWKGEYHRTDIGRQLITRQN